MGAKRNYSTPPMCVYTIIVKRTLYQLQDVVKLMPIEVYK